MPSITQAAIRLQSVWRGYLGRKVYAREILQRERGRLKSKKKPPTSTTKQPANIISKASPTKPIRQASLQNLLEDDEDDTAVPVIKVSKQPISVSSSSKLKNHHVPVHALDALQRSLPESQYASRLSSKGLEQSLDSLGQGYESEEEQVFPVAQQNDLSVIAEGDDEDELRDSLNYSLSRSRQKSIKVEQSKLGKRIEEEGDVYDSLEIPCVSVHKLPVQNVAHNNSHTTPHSVNSHNVSNNKVVADFAPRRDSKGSASTIDKINQSMTSMRSVTPSTSSSTSAQYSNSKAPANSNNSMIPRYTPAQSSNSSTPALSSHGPSLPLRSSPSLQRGEGRVPVPSPRGEGHIRHEDRRDRGEKGGRSISSPSSSQGERGQSKGKGQGQMGAGEMGGREKDGGESVMQRYQQQARRIFPQYTDVPGEREQDQEREREKERRREERERPARRSEIDEVNKALLGGQGKREERGPPSKAPPPFNAPPPSVQPRPVPSNNMASYGLPHRPLAQATPQGQGGHLRQQPTPTPTPYPAPLSLAPQQAPPPSFRPYPQHAPPPRGAGVVRQSEDLERRLLQDIASLDQKLHPTSLAPHHAPDPAPAPIPAAVVVPPKKVKEDPVKEKEKKAFGWGARDFKRGAAQGEEEKALERGAGGGAEKANRGKANGDGGSVDGGKKKGGIVIADARESVKEWQAAAQQDLGGGGMASPPRLPLDVPPSSGYLGEFQKRRQIRSKSAGRQRGAAGEGDGSDNYSDGMRNHNNRKLLFNPNAPPLPVDLVSVLKETVSLPPIESKANVGGVGMGVGARGHLLANKSRRVSSRASTRSAPSHI